MAAAAARAAVAGGRRAGNAGRSAGIRRIVLTNEVGLHARPAALLARAIAGLDAEVTVRHGEQQADARSVLGLLGLAARAGDR